MEFFLNSVANRWNDWRIGWPVVKQANTMLVPTKPVSNSANKLASCTTVSMFTNQFQSHPASFEAFQPASSRQPSLFQSWPYHSLVVNWASPFRSRPASFETGWVTNRDLTYSHTRTHKHTHTHKSQTFHITPLVTPS